MIPGVEISMGGKDWTVPPLTLGQLRRLGPARRVMTATVDARGLTDEQIDAIGQIIATALGRNYPEVTPEEVLDMLDMGNAQEVLVAVLAGSGLRRAEPGETRAVTTNGATYTGSSSPPADTATP